MLSMHLPVAHLSPGSISFCLFGNIIFPSVFLPLVLLTVVLICNHCTIHPTAKHQLRVHTETSPHSSTSEKEIKEILKLPEP